MKRDKKITETVTLADGRTVVVECDGDGVPLTLSASFGDGTGLVEVARVPAELIERLARLVAQMRNASSGESWRLQVCADHGYYVRTPGSFCPQCQTTEDAPEAAQ